MATVHVGRLLGAAGFSRTVAVKRLHDGYAKDPDFVAMLLDEARLAAVIRHPNVVPTLDVVAEQDELLVVMEYVEGDSLAHLWKLTLDAQRRIPTAFSASIVAQALHGLHAAHEARDKNGAPLGIVHRDVSPQNILVGVDGVARVLDFGIAKAASRATATEDGQIKGKTAYMAPEQLQHAAVDRRTDVFAAAVVLWEMLCARRLFFADSPSEIVAKVLAGPIDPPEKLVADLPPGLSTAVLRGLERDPAKRWATAEEMANAIEEAIALPRAKEIGAWVSSTAKTILEGRATLVQAVERSSHEMPAAQGSDSTLARAIEQAERRRQNAEMPTDVGARASAPPSAPVAESTELATVQSTIHPATAKPPVSRLGVAMAIAGAAALAIALVVVVTVTRARVETPAPASAPPIVTPAPSASASAPEPSATTEASAAPSSAPSSAPSTTATIPTKSRPPAGRPARPRKPTCDIPFTIDAKGQKHFKPECVPDP
ncbi:MAG: serine/threonine protein kinase [Labilithrix sp.]|nr:serine/threonine protein kinase [Labilithrix sp.]